MSKISTIVSEHERLFDEICGKLNELSASERVTPKTQNLSEKFSERQIDRQMEKHFERQNEKNADLINRMQNQLKKSQDELRNARVDLNEKMKSIDHINNVQSEFTNEIKKLSDQLEQERINNSKTSADLAKSLEFNLKLQFEIEEIRTRANSLVSEERKHNQFLIEKNRTLSGELELSQALHNDVRSELAKAKEKFLEETHILTVQKSELELKIKEITDNLDHHKLQIYELDFERKNKDQEISTLTETLKDFDNHSIQQADLMKNISAAAEQKIIELKLNFDRKSIECQDYYGHLQQALTQIQILRQENAALKDYISKLTALHQSRAEVTV